MQKNYSSDSLIRYIYQETNSLESCELAAALALDPVLADEVSQLQACVQELNSIELLPHPTSVQIIMEFAHRLHEPAH